MEKLTGSLQKNITKIKSAFNNSDQLVCRELYINKTKAYVLFCVGLTNVNQIGDYIIRPCLETKYKNKITIITLQTKILSFPDTKILDNVTDVVEELTHGKAVVLIDGCNNALLINCEMQKERAIGEPPTSAVLKGPRQGFTENYKTNIALIKHILATPNFKTETLKVGKYTNTNIVIVYLSGVCDKKVVDEIYNKISKIDIDGIVDSFYISSFLEVHPNSMFKQVGYSEKPDIVSAKLLEGRVAIFVDGSPIVLTLPFILLEDLQNSDDYYSQNARATLLRWLRVFSCLITLMLPGLYIAIQLYHYKVLPLTFLISIMNSTQNIPLTPFAETLFVLILFEILYEASLRMPQYLGIALSIVGALILGDTAVSAGLISPPAVLIVALSGITLYTLPDQISQLSILRIIYTLVGGMLGFYGIIVLTLFLIVYLSDFDAYGAPYLAPFAPSVFSDNKDALFKTDITNMITRPKSFRNKNKVRLTDAKNLK